MEWVIPNVIQNLDFGCVSIPDFRSAKMAPIFNRGPFLRRLRLIKILGADFAETPSFESRWVCLTSSIPEHYYSIKVF
jgi:hypothetical protein